MLADTLKLQLEALSLVDLKEQPEYGSHDELAGKLRQKLVTLRQQSMVDPATGENIWRSEGVVMRWTDTAVRVAFEQGEYYSVSNQPDSEIVHVIRLDTLRVASAKDAEAVDKALNLETVSFRMSKTEYDLLEAEARRQGLIPSAFLRQILSQEAAAIREGNLTFSGVGAGNV